MPSSRHKQRIFIGIDPGVRAIGYGVIKAKGSNVSMLDAGLLLSPKKHHNYRDVTKTLKKLITTWRPEAIGMETILFSKNVRTAIAVAEMIGVLKLVLETSGIPFQEFSPSAVKLAIAGSGNASKAMLSKMVAAILKLDSPPTPHHAADALAIALTLERQARFGLESTESKKRH
jgi:crossover junction endodeoxyribonuclease RuvC